MGFCLILHGKAFGRLKFLLRLLFSHGQLLVDCLTVENLQKWCICLIDWCCMCMHGETIGHLLLHCECA